MVCKNCGNNNNSEAKFCTYCGSPLTDVTSTVLEPTVSVTKSKKTKKDKPKKHLPKTQSFESANENYTDKLFSVGTIMFLTFLTIEWLPFLLRSIIMLSSKTVLSVFVSCFCGIVGFAVAGGILMLLSKMKGGRSPLPSALLFVSVLGAYRSAMPVLLSLCDRWIIVQALVLAVGSILTALVMANQAENLFISDTIKRGGKLLVILCMLISISLPSIIQSVAYFVPIKRTPSFLGTSAYKLLIAMISAIVCKWAIERMMSKTKAKTVNPKPFVSLIAGGCLVPVAVVALFVTTGPQNILKTVRNDVAYPLVQAEMIMKTGDMTAAQSFFELGGEHASAWMALASGSGYSMSEKYPNDLMLRYLSYLNNEDSLSSYLINECDISEMDIFAPLMLQFYSSHENLDENETAHRNELIALCIGKELFVNEYPTKKMIEKNSEKLMILENIDSTYTTELRIAKLFSSVQKDNISISNVVEEMLELAEEYPDNLSIQSAAAVICSEARWDGASHYDRTSEAVLRMVRCMKNEYEEISANLYSSSASMLISMKEYNKAVELLNEGMSTFPDDKGIKQQLAQCYMELGDKEKSYELAKEVIKVYPDDVAALWTLCVCSLKKGDTNEAISAASKLADAVKNGNSDGDSLLFNCVTELSMSDGTAGYTHNVYSADTADEPVKKIMENEFLDNYCAAVYYEKQHINYDLALENVDKALSFSENSSRLWYLKGLIHYNREEFEKSEEALLKADSLDPNDLSIMYALANTYDAMKEYQKAYDYCQRVIAKYPNGADHGEDVFGAAPHASSLLSSLKPYVEGDS